MTNQVKNMIKEKENGFKKLLENPSEENHKKYGNNATLQPKLSKMQSELLC